MQHDRSAFRQRRLPFGRIVGEPATDTFSGMVTLPLDRARWPFAALIACAAMLATAHGFQAFGYLPCPLCLLQREVFWVAGSIALLGILAAWRNVNPRILLAVNLALAAAFLVSVGVATFHSLVEWKIIALPETCAAKPLELSDVPLSEQINRRMIVPSCGEAAWRFPEGWGLSMAGWNALASLGLVAASLISAFRAGAAGPRSDTANETSPPLTDAEMRSERPAA
jgi:disulfide bond formation protein DsbB